MIEWYGYDNCGTCKKGEKFLKEKGISFTKHDITVDPPPKALLKRLLAAGYSLQKLFNTSGVAYRELKIKEKLPRMTEEEALTLLASNGRLIKRPVVFDEKRCSVGFDEKQFTSLWS